MLHAIENPTTKLATIAAAAGLAGMLALASAREDTVIRRLVLTAPEQPNAIYLTAWHQGDVFVRVPSGEPRGLTFQVRALVSDGCEWLATERLVPTGGNVYAYSYEEEIVACEPGATPAIKTPRTGIVLSLPAR
jgi:hypothetical protein